MIPGHLPRPIDGLVYYATGEPTQWRIFEPPAAPAQNGNDVVIAAGRPRRKAPPPAPAAPIRPDGLSSPAVSFPPDPADDT